MDVTRTILNSKRVLAGIVVVSTLAALVLVVAGKAPVTRNVLIEDFGFHPNGLNIQPGSTIVWHNKDPVIHTLWFVGSDGRTFELSGPIAPDGKWEYVFDDEMELQYFSFKKLWITGFINIDSANKFVSNLEDAVNTRFGQAIFKLRKTGYHKLEVEIEKCTLLANKKADVYLSDVLIGTISVNRAGNGAETLMVEHISTYNSLTIQLEGTEVLHSGEWSP